MRKVSKSQSRILSPLAARLDSALRGSDRLAKIQALQAYIPAAKKARVPYGAASAYLQHLLAAVVRDHHSRAAAVSRPVPSSVSFWL